MRIRATRGTGRWGSGIPPGLAIALLVATSPACRDVNDNSPSGLIPLSPELSHYLNNTVRVAGGLDTSSVDGILTNVWYGRILPGRRGVILADRTDPFLRIFDRTGQLVTVALPAGEGPKEARRVAGLAVSDAGEVLVLTGLRRTRLVEYAVEGDSLRFIRGQPSPPDIPMFTVASRCGRGWAAYTTRSLRSPASIPVLAVSDRDAAGALIWRNVASWYTRTSNLNWGSPQDMTSDARNVYVWHKYSVEQPILAIPCEERGDSAWVLRTTAYGSSDPAMQPFDEGGGVLVLPDTLFTGFAVLRGSLLESETVAEDWSRFEMVTIFSVTEGGSRRSVLVPGDWRILDGRDGELLIYGEHARTLNPIVLLVPMGVVQRAVSGA